MQRKFILTIVQVKVLNQLTFYGALLRGIGGPTVFTPGQGFARPPVDNQLTIAKYIHSFIYSVTVVGHYW